MTLTVKSSHLAWCALVALALTRQDAGILSPAQENLFLTRWLATALKQRRFSRDVTPGIEWLLKQGRQLGVGAKLASKLNYLWRSCTVDSKVSKLPGKTIRYTESNFIWRSNQQQCLTDYPPRMTGPHPWLFTTLRRRGVCPPVCVSV